MPRHTQDNAHKRPFARLVLGRDHLAEATAEGGHKESFKVTPQLKRTSTLLLNASFHCEKSSSASLILKLLDTFLTADAAFYAVFSERLLAQVQTFQHSFASARVIAIRMLSRLIRHDNAKTPGSSPALKPLIHAQVSILEATSDTDNARLKLSGHKSILQLVKSSPAYFELYFDAISTTSTAADSATFQTRFHLTKLLVDTFAATFSNAQRLRLLTSYTYWALEAKVRPTDSQLQSYAGFVSTISADEFASVVEPVLSRLLKRSPDSLLQAVRVMTQSLRIDLGLYMGPMFVPVFTAKLRSQKDDVRINCIGLVDAVLRRCADFAHVLTILTEVLGVLDGKHGILAQFYQREAVFTTLYNASLHAPAWEGAAADLAALVLPSLVQASTKEANEGTRYIGLQTVSQWLSLLHPTTTNTLPADISAFFTSGLQHKVDSAVVAHAYAVLSARETVSTALAQDVSIVRELVRLVDTANKKPNVLHLDGVLALSVLASLHESHPAQIASVLDVPSALVNDSFFATSAALLLQASSSSPPSVPAAGIDSPEVAVLKALPQTITSVLTRSTPSNHRLFGLLISGINHANASVRSTFQAKISSFVSANTWSSVHFLDAFAQGLLDLNDLKIVSPEDNVPDKSVGTSMSGVLRKNLRTLVPATVYDSDLAVELLPRLLLLTHHPLLVFGAQEVKFSREWNVIKKRFVEHVDEDLTVSDAVDDLFEFIPRLKSATVDAVLASLYSDVHNTRLSGHRAIVTLLNFAGNGVGEHLVLHGLLKDQVAHRLGRDDITAVTADDVAIYHTPDDELYVAKKADESAAAAAYRDHGTADERWEQQVRAEIERKRGLLGTKAADAKKKLTKDEVDLLHQQKQVRRRVGAAYTVVARVDSLLTFLSVTSPDEIQAALPYLVQPVLSLLGSPLLSTFAQSSLRSICRCVVPTHLRVYSNQLAKGLEIAFVATHGPSDQAKATLAASNDLFERLFKALVNAVFGYEMDSETDFELDGEYNLLPPSTFHLVYPILAVFLDTSSTSRFKQFILPLFSVHAKMIKEEDEMEVGDVAAQRLLRESMIVLTLSWLARAENDGWVAAAQVLAQLTAGSPLSSAEFAPLLGDAGLLSSKVFSRRATLQAIRQGSDITDAPEPAFSSTVFMSCYDKDDDNKEVAQHIWTTLALDLPDNFTEPLLKLLSHPNACIRESAGTALAHGLKRHRDQVRSVLDIVRARFIASLPVPTDASQVDSFGIPIVHRRPNNHHDVPVEAQATLLTRVGAGILFEHTALETILTPSEVVDVLKFIIERGLGDSSADVRHHMRKAGVQVIATYGAANIAELVAILEAPYAAPGTSPEDIAAFDHQKEGMVVFLGSLARHMDKADPKVASIVQRLLDSLKIPSEPVQRAIALCLSPLIPAVKDQSTDILNSLLTDATQGETYGDRMGAAFGVSAVVKGLGIAALKQHAIIPRLEEAMKSANSNSRQGALTVIECLCARLGFLFEPYVIVILPILLKSFADTNASVRDAASLTSKGIMKNLSAHGVKLVLPSILRAVDDSQWRTKQAAIQLLGAMAFCAPKQLGSCLPQIIPKLTESLSDSHPRVKEAGHSAMHDIAHVIRNPEVSSISSVLLAGIQDPNRKTNEALQALQSMVFVHSIDAPSMALIMPILQRGLMDRLSDTKKKAALIVGNMCSMVNDAKDLVPYLDTIAPCLLAQLLDPIPEVRTVASKALGMLVKGLGQSHFPTLVSSLLSAMKADSSAVERSGSAQGLCEVLVALGMDSLDTFLQEEIFPIARHPKSAVREGVLWVIAFLPPALGQIFSRYLTRVLPMVVAGLSDEVEGVREVAMHAGSIVVTAHALTHTKDILPSLEAGIFDDNWRIRQSSISLLGDLLYRISGTSGNKVVYANNAADSDDEDDSVGSAAGERAILRVLGKTRRDLVLSSLYMVRSDNSAIVRQASLGVWKSVVSNTPKTLRSILETLMNTIVEALAGSHFEKQAVAGRTLGEIVRKLGERVMPEVVPILRSGLAPANSDGMRQGVCLGLSEVIGSSSKKQLEDFVDTLVDALEEALCDFTPEVRAAAGQAFNVFHKNMGYRSIDEVVPRLLRRVQSTEGEAQRRALYGLQEVLRAKSREVLPYLIPRLLTTPLTQAHVRAIAHIASVSGHVIHYHIDRIMGVLFSEYVSFAGKHDDIMTTAIKTTLQALVLSVEDQGVQWLSSEMCKFCDSDIVEARYLACWLISAFCQATTANYNEQVPTFIRYILHRFNDADASVVQAASHSFNSLNTTIRPDELAKHIDFIRNNLNSMVSDARHRKGGVGSGEFLLPGLTLPKGLEPFLPAYQFALMNGTPEARQSAAAGIGELVLLSNDVCLKSVLIKLTGPLIRIAGDRFPPHVKSAILSTLEILLVKGGASLKPFLPQLQTTFVKALNDPSGEVRTRGGTALAQLVKFSPRVDPLVSELLDKLGSSTGGVKEANLQAILATLSLVGSKLSPATLQALYESLRDCLDSEEDVLRTVATNSIGLIFDLSDEIGASHFADLVFASVSISTWTRKHSSALLLQHALASTHTWVNDALAGQIQDHLVVLARDDKPLVRIAALEATTAAISRFPATFADFVPSVVAGLGDANKDVLRAALRVVKKVSKHTSATTRPFLGQLVAPTFVHIKSPNIGVKFAAERALLYLLEVHSRPATIADFAAVSDQGKLLTEYVRRVLSKLNANSDSENDA
ncbi:hypothetical protein DYB31_000087 [Aphanomyces astaci]|uniref:TOG domain-containing protein n=1 Tax=Aphanomyces astaci TaxID=112090 RepID=A0A397EUN6_APHAT|nr:hypothetical protein DYB31_000087 [Aphanomyces astaci]